MNNWIDRYQQTWQQQSAGDLSAQMDTLRDRISSDKRKDILSTLWMSLGLLIGLGVIYRVAAEIPQSDWKTWVLLLTMAGLLVLTIALRLRSHLLRPNETETGAAYLEQMLKSYTFRFHIITKWFWAYMIILPSTLIVFMYQVYSKDLLTATWISVGILLYEGIVLFLSRNKYRKNVSETQTIINELEEMQSNWEHQNKSM